MSSKQRHLYEFGPFCLNMSERLLSRDGEPVSLPPKALETLIVLVRQQGRLVEKEELMKALWPESFVEEANLSHHVWTLRRTLGEGQKGRRYIETVPRRGYRFVAAVKELTDTNEASVLEKHSFTRIVTVEEEEVAVASIADSGDSLTVHLRSAAPDPRPHDRALTAAPARPRRSRALAAAALFVAGAVTVLGSYWLISLRRPGENRAAALPFREMDISRLTTSGKITHAAISRDGKYVAHVTEDAEGDSLWVSHVDAPRRVRIAGPAATEYVSVTFAPDGDSIYYLTVDRDKGDTALYRVPVLGGPSSMAARDVGPVGFSPDASRITFIKSNGEKSYLIVAQADGTNERTLATRLQPEFFQTNWIAPAWSPDGKTIACQVRLNDERGQFETLIGLSVEDGTQLALTSKRWNYVGQPAWLADGSGLLVTARESATDPQQVWHVVLKSGAATRITHDLNDYHSLSLTGDASRLAAVQDHSVSTFWVAPEGDAGRAKQIASDIGWIQEMAWTPDGRIVYRSNAGGSAEIWVMNADGSNPKQLTVDARVSRGLTVSPDGRYIFFASDRAGRSNIWRMDEDGGGLKQLTTGDSDLYPCLTPDGLWVVFQRRELEPRLWKVPMDGGEPVQLTQTRASRPSVSPDGAMIAYHYLDPDVDSSRWRIGIVSSQGGPRLKQFDFPPTLTWRFVRWSPDRQSIAYANNPGGLSDIWLQPLDGGQPKRLTDFKAEQVIAFDWSRDGHTLALVLSVKTSDVILIGAAALK